MPARGILAKGPLPSLGKGRSVGVQKPEGTRPPCAPIPGNTPPSSAPEAGHVHGLSKAGRPLLVRYDLDALGRQLRKEDLAPRDGGFWRYREFLPVTQSQNVVALGEVMTPLIPLSKMGEALGGSADSVIIKDEGRLPTGSFKARGLALAVAMAKELGLSHLAMPTNGNAGAAMAAYASRAGLRTTIFC
ncbi:MAG: pyridoxal-phosphate dependent enzyme, partial [Pseudomonadales bacterium]